MPYQKFLHLLRERKILSTTLSLLSWDEQVNLPPRGAEVRAEQMGVISKLIHQKNTEPEFVALLKELYGDEGLTPTERVVVNETWREVERSLKVPSTLVGEIAEKESSTFGHWVEARKKSDFNLVKDKLAELFRLKQQYAACLSGGLDPYDSLLDLYEAGLRREQVNKLFDELRPALSELLAGCAKQSPPQRPFQGDFDRAEQRKLCLAVAQRMGFDFERGRLDESEHPFCYDIGNQDVRMTTRYRDDCFAPALYGCMHEAGHGLYEQGLDEQTIFTPLSEYCSMAIHESQSRLWENTLGRSWEFINYLHPQLTERFPGAMRGVSAKQVYAYVNWVYPSFVRVEADEVSYGLHIIIRYELERDLFSSAISFSDLPEYWAHKYFKYLGIRPQRDIDGILQDVHWFTGNFGYFPTYLLGSAYAAQIFNAASRSINNLSSLIAKGELLELRKWLQENIHQHGKRYRASELIRRACGAEPEVKSYISYLRTKYAN